MHLQVAEKPKIIELRTSFRLLNSHLAFSLIKTLLYFAIFFNSALLTSTQLKGKSPIIALCSPSYQFLSICLRTQIISPRRNVSSLKIIIKSSNILLVKIKNIKVLWRCKGVGPQLNCYQNYQFYNFFIMLHKGQRISQNI